MNSGLLVSDVGHTNSSEFIHSLASEMRSKGVFILGEVNPFSSRFQRFKDASYPWKSKSIFIKIIGANYGAIFGDWRQGCWHFWFAQDWKKLSQQEKSRRILEFEMAKNQLKQEQEEAINNCKIIFNLSEELNLQHYYIQRKGIMPFCARQYAEMIVVPVYSLSGQIQTLQYIYPDGYKRFHEGAVLSGGFLILGENISDSLNFCEGWSTACSIFSILQQPVIVTFSCHNMKKVALTFKKKFPYLKLKVFADNDHQNNKNYGLITAREIQTSTGARICYPTFPSGLNAKGSDFNDLIRISGINEARKQILGLTY